MRRPTLLRSCALLFTLAAALISPHLGTTALAKESQRPNIVLCMADDQGWGDVGYRDHPVLKTPTLDAMAASALRFERFYAAAPVCSPTRGSVLTGRHPNRFACFSWGHSLRPQEFTIAEALKTAGYATGHFGKWHLGSVRADSPVCPGSSGFDVWFSSPNFFDNHPLMSREGKVVETQGESSQVTVDAAIEFIRAEAKRKRPFLAVVWFGSPHGPHIALEVDREPYKDQPERLQHFYGELTAMDRAIGNLRDELRKLNIAENTLFWYTSDNGALPVGSTGGLSGKKGNLLEGGIRVPAIIEWPARIKSPRTSYVPCSSVDIYPTLLDLAGIKLPGQPPLDGQSLLPLVDGKMTKRDKPLGFWVYPTGGIPMRSRQMLAAQAAEQGQTLKSQPATRPNKSKKRKPRAGAGEITKRYSDTNPPGPAALIDGDYKLHRKPAKSGEATYTLFNLANDAAEKTNLADKEPQRVEKMKAALSAWQKSVIKSLNGEDYGEN